MKIADEFVKQLLSRQNDMFWYAAGLKARATFEGQHVVEAIWLTRVCCIVTKALERLLGWI